MHKVILTGAQGTMGSVLQQQLDDRSIEVVPWDRKAIAPDNPETIERFLDDTAPDTLFHLAIASQPTGMDNEGMKINVEWPAFLAAACAQRNIQFVFTSTVMVFTEKNNGPYTAESQPDASEGYGYEKLLAEQRIREANDRATTARCGWQIGTNFEGNNMLNFLESKTKDEGKVSASAAWKPACSFLEDTANALIDLTALPPDVYLIDSNEDWTFYELTCALNHLYDNRWNIERSDDFVYDQRMIDPRVPLPSLQERLLTAF